MNYEKILSSKIKESDSLMNIIRALTFNNENSIDLLKYSFFNVDKVSGYYLDNLGLILGFKRPYILKSESDIPLRFNTTNTSIDSYRAFNTGVFVSSLSITAQYISDVEYKKVLKSFMSLKKNIFSTANILTFIKDYFFYVYNSNIGIEVITNASCVFSIKILGTSKEPTFDNILNNILRNNLIGILINIEYA